MKRLLYTILNIIALQFLSFGQDTIKHIPDSFKSARNRPDRRWEQSCTINYGAPALLLTYGLISLENKPVQRLDKYISHEPSK